MYYNCVTNTGNANLSKEDLMLQLQSYGFAINDLALYLDTHPDDEKALRLHNQYARQYKEMYDEYERRFGPLTIFCPCKTWRWQESPWPWEGGNI